jgi:phospholipid transport system substrate-binding protein
MLNYTRRAVLGVVLVLAAAFTMPQASSALSNSSAEALIDKVVADINRVIGSGKSESAMLKDFEGIFERFSDESYIAAYAMGVDARRATSAQKRAFSDAFGTYISRKYGKRFREFIGGTIDVNGVKQVKSWYEVRAVVKLRGKAPFDVTFFVSDRTGKDLFFNIYIEGVNLLLSEREEIGAMLDRRGGNIDAMIADLRAAS